MGISTLAMDLATTLADIQWKPDQGWDPFPYEN